MRLMRLELYKYSPFRFSEIKLLDLEMTSPIQNIIGTNGSGKTSLLQELNPLPATRTEFGENGYKKITLVHDNHEYILTSDFSKSSGWHSFVKDDEELNPSGITSIQEDLVAKHIGYTNSIHNICYGNYQLNKMPVGSRKTFLLTIHPCQMKLILDKHKKIVSALRACKDNLIMLHERKATLETEMLDPHLIYALQEESDGLTDEIAAIVGAIHRLINQKMHLQKMLGSQVVSHRFLSKQEIFKQFANYQNYTNIPRDVPIDQLQNTYMNEVAILETKINTFENRAQDLAFEIDKYEDHIRQNDAKGALDLVESSIAILSQDIQDLSRNQTETPFDSYVLNQLPSQISRLTDMVAFFIGYQYPIPSMKAVETLRLKLQNLQSKQHKTGYELEKSKELAGQYHKALSEQLIADIPDGCHGCLLFKKYRNTLIDAQMKWDIADQEVTRLERKNTRLSRVILGRSEQLMIYQQSVPQLQRISDFFNEHRYLLNILKDVDLLQILRKNPSLLIVKIQTHYEQSMNHHLLCKKKEELHKLILEQEKLKTPAKFAQGFLEQMVCDKQQELQQIRQDYEQLKRKRHESKEFLTLITDYKTSLNKARDDLVTLENLQDHKTLLYEKDLCDLYLKHLESAKQIVIARLTEIERILQGQSLLQARYRDEIMNSIEKIQKQEIEYSELEKALSPMTGIPHRYMVQFLNEVLTDANIFMSQVIAYPFEFVLFDENSELDYKFKMLVGDIPIPDISEGSDAQQEMANFAFNLGLMVQLKLFNYPLLLDECGRSFDVHHKQKLVEFLKTIIDDGLIHQLFLINHHAIISAGLLHSETLVLSPDNIVVPELYNQNVILEKY